MLEPYELEDRRQARWEEILKGRPDCADCGKPIQTQYCVKMDVGEYICWGCLNNRRCDTAEEFDLE